VEPPAGEVPCPTAAELDLIDSEVTLSFEGGSVGGPLLCRALDGSRDLTEVEAKVYQALALMKSITFDSPLPWTDRSLYDWFRLSVAGVRFRTDITTAGCCNPARVINMPGGSLAGSTRWSYLEGMVHEARHTNNVPHTCGTLDNTIAELGAYGVTYQLMVWIGTRWPAATQAERDYVLNRAALLRASAFCKECE
jgi:hypothetical protein